MQTITIRRDCFTLAKTLRDAHESLLDEVAQGRVSICASCERG